VLIVLKPVLRAVGVSGVWDFLLITMIASIAVGVLSYWLIERPLLRLFHLKLYRKSVRVPAGP
jgi:peptidoglycan/LPS O-acetylase OafA/YrhL